MTTLELTVMLLTFFIMEGVAWAAHKYLMHGFLWFLHDDHHTKTPGALEKNDTFFLIFAIPSWLCIMLGLMYGAGISVAVGGGIALYGFAYAMVHELFINVFQYSNKRNQRILRPFDLRTKCTIGIWVERTEKTLVCFGYIPNTLNKCVRCVLNRNCSCLKRNGFIFY